MGWLKDEVDEITRTVASWPAWKRESEGRMDDDLSYGAIMMLTKGHGTSELYRRIEHALAEKDQAYRQLTAQAIGLAQLAMSFSIEEYPYMVKQAIAFMDSPEAQAFLKEHT